MKKKDIIIFEYLNGFKEIYEYLKEKSPEQLNLFYLPYSRINRYNYRFGDFYDRFKKIRSIGILNLIRILLNNKSTLAITETSFKYQHYFSNNIIFLNHGWGTKKTPGNNEINDPDIMDKYKNILNYCKYIICLSDFDASYFLQHPLFRDYPRPVFYPLGLPRNDFLVKNMHSLDIINQVCQSLKINKEQKRVILYAPTHREEKENNEVFLYNLMEQFKALDEKLSKTNTIILFRPHYYSIGLENIMSMFQNIKYVGYDCFPDVRPLMICSDLLITDYSSIFIDYLLINKPIIFYPFDLKEYKKLRGLAIDFENPLHVPGPKIHKLMDILDLGHQDFSKFNNHMSKHFFHKYTDDKATERIADLLLNEVNKK